MYGAISLLVVIFICSIYKEMVQSKDCKTAKEKVESFTGACKNCEPIPLTDVLEEIYAEPRIHILPHYHGPNFKFSHNDRKVQFSCKALFQTALSYKGKDNEECDMTPEFEAKYTCDGHISGSVSCLHNPPEKQNGATTVWKWNEETVTEACDRFNSCAYYGNSACAESMQKYADTYVKDKVGMVLGTQVPWVEGGLIAWGAKKVITVEYNPIVSTYDRVSSIHPFVLAEKYVEQSTKQNEADLVDFIYSYSSLEHDGLGRYGDPMNPFADLESIARAYCLLKHDGVLFLGFPIGPDYVANNHRIYGKLRTSLFLPMWEPLDIINHRYRFNDTSFLGNYNNQPVWVLKKKGHIGQTSTV